MPQPLRFPAAVVCQSYRVGEMLQRGRCMLRQHGWTYRDVQPGYSRAATDADVRCTGSVDPHDLPAETLARATVAETLPAQRLISSVPPVKYQKTVDTGARHMMS